MGGGSWEWVPSLTVQSNFLHDRISDRMLSELKMRALFIHKLSVIVNCITPSFTHVFPMKLSACRNLAPCVNHAAFQSCESIQHATEDNTHHCTCSAPVIGNNLHVICRKNSFYIGSINN